MIDLRWVGVVAWLLEYDSSSWCDELRAGWDVSYMSLTIDNVKVMLYRDRLLSNEFGYVWHFRGGWGEPKVCVDLCA